MTFTAEGDGFLDSATVSSPGEDGYHNGKDHDLVSFGDFAVALYSGPDEPGGGAFSRTIRITSAGIVLGEPRGYVSWGENGTDYWNTHRTRRVGNSDLIVQWRQSGSLWTLRYEPETDTFESRGFDFPVLAGQTDDYGGLVVPVDDETILLVRDGLNEPSIGGHATGHLAYARWDGNSIWTVGDTLATTDLVFGSSNYQDGEFLGTDGIVLEAEHHPPGGPYEQRHVLIAGSSYPDAPVIASYTVSSGEQDYFNRQMYPAAEEPGTALRFAAVTTGTTTPIIGGSSSFDWGMTKLTVVGGDIVEGPYVNTGPTTDWYDVAAAQTSDGHTWVIHEKSTVEHNSPFFYPDSTLQVRDLTDGVVGTIHDDDDYGIAGNDYSIRCAAAIGPYFIAGYCSVYNAIFRIVAYGSTLPDIEGQQVSTRVRFI